MSTEVISTTIYAPVRFGQSALFERLLSLRNDLGLLSEEYDPADRRQLGNFPQAFSHLALINSAYNLTLERKPLHQRAHDEHAPPEEMAATVAT